MIGLMLGMEDWNEFFVAVYNRIILKVERNEKLHILPFLRKTCRIYSEF
jgi:hypothetical protein